MSLGSETAGEIAVQDPLSFLVHQQNPVTFKILLDRSPYVGPEVPFHPLSFLMISVSEIVA